MTPWSLLSSAVTVMITADRQLLFGQQPPAPFPDFTLHPELMSRETRMTMAGRNGRFVCVCVRERGGGRVRGAGSLINTLLY